jgi:RNA polymerase sigma-70 factor, ECF subfamily
MQSETSTTRDDSASARLYQRYGKAIFAYLRGYHISREDAEDVLLEVFLAALEHPHFLAIDEKAQLAWLRRVAHNKVVDLYRHSLHHPSVALERLAEPLYEDEALTPEHMLLQEEKWAWLRASLKNLSPLQQEVLHLRFTEELRCAEIASRVGKSEVAVRILLSRTLNLLRDTYEKQPGGTDRDARIP